MDITRKIAQQWRTLSPEQKQVCQSFTLCKEVVASRKWSLWSFFFFLKHDWSSLVLSCFSLSFFAEGVNFLSLSLSPLAVWRSIFARQREVQSGSPELHGPAHPGTSPARSPGEETEESQEEGHPQKESKKGLLGGMAGGWGGRQSLYFKLKIESVFQIVYFCAKHLIFWVPKCAKWVHTEKFVTSASVPLG